MTGFQPHVPDTTTNIYQPSQMKNYQQRANIPWLCLLSSVLTTPFCHISVNSIKMFVPAKKLIQTYKCAIKTSTLVPNKTFLKHIPQYPAEMRKGQHVASCYHQEPKHSRTWKLEHIDTVLICPNRKISYSRSSMHFISSVYMWIYH